MSSFGGFGSPQNTFGGFGQPQQQQQHQQQQQPTSGFGFGNTTSNPPSSIFGAPSFGSSAASAVPFGSNNTSGPFGAPGAFGAAAPVYPFVGNPQQPFGAPPAATRNPFGTPPPSFSQPPSAFGAAPFTTFPAFGQPSSALTPLPATGFGQLSNAAPNPVGQPSSGSGANPFGGATTTGGFSQDPAAPFSVPNPFAMGSSAPVAPAPMMSFGVSSNVADDSEMMHSSSPVPNAWSSSLFSPGLPQPEISMRDDNNNKKAPLSNLPFGTPVSTSTWPAPSTSSAPNSFQPAVPAPGAEAADGSMSPTMEDADEDNKEQTLDNGAAASSAAQGAADPHTERLAQLKAKLEEKKRRLEEKRKNEASQKERLSPQPPKQQRGLDPSAQPFVPGADDNDVGAFSLADRSLLPSDLRDESADYSKLRQTHTTAQDLGSAKSLVGTCLHMCPDEELLRREQEGDIQLLELVRPGDLHPAGWTLRNTTVKRFRRSAADYKLDVPEWVRPPHILERVCAYLEEWVMERDRQGPDVRFQSSAPPSLDVYQFIWDRTRMVRKDFILQNYVGTGGNCNARAVRCHERIARWHAMCEHQLSHIDDFARMQSQQNIQELGQTMKTLNQYYDDALKRSTVEEPDDEGKETVQENESKESLSHGCQSNIVQGVAPKDFDGTPLKNDEDALSLSRRAIGKPNQHGTAEPEMSGLYILLTIDNDGGMEVLKYAAHLSRVRPHIYRSKPVQLALSIYKAKKEVNYAAFFQILQSDSTPYLLACIMLKHVEFMRKRAFEIMSRAYGGISKEGNEAIYDSYPLNNLVKLLCFEDADDAHAACKHYNITVNSVKVRSSTGGSRMDDIVFWKQSKFSEPKDEDKGTVVPLRPRKMVRTIEAKLGGATRLAVCRGELSGEGAFFTGPVSSQKTAAEDVTSHHNEQFLREQEAKRAAEAQRRAEEFAQQKRREEHEAKQRALEAEREQKRQETLRREQEEKEREMKRIAEAKEAARLKAQEEERLRQEAALRQEEARKAEEQRLRKELEENERKEQERKRAEELLRHNLEQELLEAERKRAEAGALLLSPFSTLVHAVTTTTTTVRLCCSSPDGKLWHALLPKQTDQRNSQTKYILFSRRIRNSNERENQDVATTTLLPAVIETELPQAVQESLAEDEPLELLCVEAEGNELQKIKLRGSDGAAAAEDDGTSIALPRLCLYSRKAVFVLQPAFDPKKTYNDHEEDDRPVPGKIVSMTEPLEQYFLQNNFHSTEILRIRPAPQRWTGHALHSPAGCLAILTADTTNKEYQITCFEANGKIKDPPFVFAMEQVLENTNQEKIVDFCFAQSNGLGLLSSMAILLLKASGDVLAASPFVFHGSLVPRPALEECLTFLQTQLDKLDRSQPLWRQYRAAQQYLKDAFPQTDRQTRFVTAKTWSAYTTKMETASRWPVKLQGPILFKNPDAGDDDDADAEEEEDDDNTDGNHALVIENFGNSDLVGFCVGAQNGQVDFGVTSPTTIVPRFAFESRNDAFALDDEIFKCSAWVERVALGLETSDSGSLALCRDPNLDSVLHVVSTSIVASISTNSVQRASVQIRQGSRAAARIEPTTMAWSCLEQPLNVCSIQGVVTTIDNIDGHKLLIQLTNGTVQTVNVTEEKAMWDLQAVKTQKPVALKVLEAPKEFRSEPCHDQASAVLDSTPPFYETVAPHIEKINKGLSSMGKIVGSETRYEDITVDMLAVVAAIQERCENEVALPVLELASVIQKRRDALRTMMDSQTVQIAKLLESQKMMEERNQRIRNHLATAEGRAWQFKERIQAAQEACKDLTPNVTNAELEFFKFVKQMKVKTNKWETQVQELCQRIQQQCQSVVVEGNKTISADLLDANMASDLKRINVDTERRIIQTRQTLKETEHRLNAVLRKAGLEAPWENMSANNTMSHV